MACGSNTTRRPRSCVSNVVNVSSASEEVSIRPPRASRLARVCNWAPPARQAMRAEHVLPAPGGRLGGDVLVADEPGQVVARAAALLDVGGDRAHLRVGQVPGHLAQRGGLEDDVGVRDQERLHPVVLEDDGQAVIERVGLSLAALARGAGGRRWPGYWAALAIATSGVSSVLASSTRKIAQPSRGYSSAMSRSIEAPMTAASFQAGIRTAVRGKYRLAGAIVVAPEVTGHQQELPGSRPARGRRRRSPGRGESSRRPGEGRRPTSVRSWRRSRSAGPSR